MYEKLRLSELQYEKFNPDSIVFFQIADFIPKYHVNAVLDYGAGNSPYKAFISCDQYYTADISQNVFKNIQYIIHEDESLAIPDASFDLILLLDVLEHVPRPKAVLLELKRLMRPHGSLIISVPFLYREHETPNDYLRVTSFGAVKLLEEVGLRVYRSEKIGNVFYTILTLLLERNIENGECVNISYKDIIFNKLILMFVWLFRKSLSKKPKESAGTYHHLLLEVRL